VRYTPAEVSRWRGNRGERPLFISLAELLDDYNNGLLFECGDWG